MKKIQNCPKSQKTDDHSILTFRPVSLLLIEKNRLKKFLLAVTLSFSCKQTSGLSIFEQGDSYINQLFFINRNKALHNRLEVEVLQSKYI